MCFFLWIRRKLLSVLQPEGTTPLKWGMITALYFCMVSVGLVGKYLILKLAMFDLGVKYMPEWSYLSCGY